MSKDNLQQCPKCRKGRMRPTGRAGTKGEKEDSFREISYARNYICDNCSHHMSDAKNTEYMEVSDSVTYSVDKAGKNES
ncbi:MAG: hypothetical protein M3227_04805 [Thermoproteota archaeon]|nr:hypothetical protein [Thermoproteota archaeon]